jgi:hypothetical protein
MAGEDFAGHDRWEMDGFVNRDGPAIRCHQRSVLVLNQGLDAIEKDSSVFGH